MTIPDPTPFVHRFEPASVVRRPPLLLLHGTGGDETDLLGLGRALAPGSALLSPRGQVLEHGMPRFFRRLAEGVFDEEDVIRRAGDLARFVAEARLSYDLEAPIAVGFSNGANVAAALLLLHPDVLAGAVLIRPMSPLASPPTAALDGRPVLMLSGASDPIAPEADAARLAERLAASGAKVEHRLVPAGHGMSQIDLGLAAAWMKALGRDGKEPARGSGPVQTL